MNQVGSRPRRDEAAQPRDGFLLFLKRECPTCALVAPLVAQLERDGVALTALSQDDPSFPPDVDDVVDDTALEWSFRYAVETVPTLIRIANGAEVERTFGWDRDEWARIIERPGLGASLPPFQPGCGSKSVEPGAAERLLARFGDPGLRARSIAIGEYDDPVEACYERGWSDGLPVVPPTDERILRMLAGTSRDRGEVVGRVPPNLVECTVEKVAINAVMAGCKPEYMPVVLAALEAALDPMMTLHGLTCSTCFSGPIAVVNGPIARAIGMNAGMNVLGQGNRANSTIMRAVNLVVRNVGGAVPGVIDRSTLGGPHKIGLAFAEDESDPAWQPLAQARGVSAGKSAVTLFGGDAIQGFIDQRSRTPEELVRSLAMSLVAVGHPKLFEFLNAMLVLAPEHYGIFKAAGWGRAQIESALYEALKRPARDLVQGAQGVGEGISAARAEEIISKFWPGGLLVVRAGGEAGLFSAILPGWTGSRFREQCAPVTKVIQ